MTKQIKHKLFYRYLLYTIIVITTALIIYFTVNLPQTTLKQHNNPYSLAQVKQHLQTIYSEDIRRKDTLRRWDLDLMTYDVGTSNKALSEAEKQIFFDKFKIYGDIVGIKTKRNRQAGKTNVVLTFTDDFSRTVKNPKLRRVLFGGATQKSVNEQIKEFKRTNNTSYGAQWSVKSHKLDRQYSLNQTSDIMKKHLKKWADYAVFNTFAVRWNSRRSNIIEPSILNKQQNKNLKLHPIDRYYLEVLYSNKVHYGMEMNQAIDIMANYIYKQLGE